MGHWEVLGGHPGNMGPKRKRKGQYSPYVDHREPDRWRKKMDRGRGPGKQPGLTIDEALQTLFEKEIEETEAEENFVLDPEIYPHKVVCVCGSKNIQWAQGGDEGIGGRIAWKIGVGYIPNIPASSRVIGCKKCGRIAAHPGVYSEKDGLYRYRVIS